MIPLSHHLYICQQQIGPLGQIQVMGLPPLKNAEHFSRSGVESKARLRFSANGGLLKEVMG